MNLFKIITLFKSCDINFGSIIYFCDRPWTLSDSLFSDEHKRRDSYFVPSNSAYFKKIGDKKNPKKKKKRKKKSENDQERNLQKSPDKFDDPDARPRPKFPSGRIRTSSESRIDPIVHEAHAEESEGEETEEVVTKDVVTKDVVTKDEPSSIPSIPIILSEPVPSIPQPISNEPISLIVQPEQAKIKLSIITEHGKFCSRSDTFIKDLKR